MTFGQTNPMTNYVYFGGAQNKLGTKYDCTLTEDVNAILVYITGANSSHLAGTARACLYDALTNQLVAVSSESTIPTLGDYANPVYQYVQFDIPLTTLVAGKQYWLLIHKSDITDLFATGVASQYPTLSRRFEDVYADGTSPTLDFTTAVELWMDICAYATMLGPKNPTANFTFSPATPAPNTGVTFDASPSLAGDSPIANYAWDFGDGFVGTGVMVQHSYAINGDFTATLTVTDNDGRTDSVSQTITVATTQYKLTVLASANGTCDLSVGDHIYTPPNTTVTVMATPNNGFSFLQWVSSDGSVNGVMANPISIELSADITLQPTFTSTGTQITLGRTSLPNNDRVLYMVPDQKSGTVYTATASGNVNAIFVNCITAYGSVPAIIRACIYDYTTKALLGITEEKQVPTDAYYWIRCDLLAPVPIVAGRQYMLMVQTGGRDIYRSGETVPFGTAITYTLTDTYVDGADAVLLDPPVPADDIKSWQETGIYATTAGPPTPMPPTANFAISKTPAIALLPVTFDATASLAGFDGELPTRIVSYVWDFGDGSIGTGVMVEHTYVVANTYDVKLTITDSQAKTSILTKQLQVIAVSTTNTLTIQPATVAGGHTDPSYGNYQYTLGTKLPVMATEHTGYRFVAWILDGNNIGDLNPYTVLFDESSHTLQPIFELQLPDPTSKFVSEIRGVYLQYLWDDDTFNTASAQTLCQTLLDNKFNSIVLALGPLSWTGFTTNKWGILIPVADAMGIATRIVLTGTGNYDPSYTDNAEAPAWGWGWTNLTGADPDWRSINSAGVPQSWCCVNRPSTKARQKQVVQQMLQKYPSIVEVTLDYIRFPESPQDICYCDVCRGDLVKWLESKGKPQITNWSDFYPNGARYTEFQEWRCTIIDDTVKNMRNWMKEVRPSIIVTTTTYTPWGGWLPDSNKRIVGQDTALWMSKNMIDYNIPMHYISDLAVLQDRVSKEVIYWTGADKGVVPLLSWLTQGDNNTDSGPTVTPQFFGSEVEYLRSRGFNGFIIWRYSGPGFVPINRPMPDIVPYMQAVASNTTKGAFPIFSRSGIVSVGSTISWITSLPTIGKVEYSQNPLFNTVWHSDQRLPYNTNEYVAGMVLGEASAKTNHSLTIPLQPPFYFRILDNDGNIELVSPTYATPGLAGSATVTFTALGNGAIEADGVAVSGNKTYTVGDSVTLTALPQSGATFHGWKLDGVNYSTENPMTLAITADLDGKIITADFTTPIQAGFPIWALIPVGAVGAWYLLKGKKNKRK